MKEQFELWWVTYADKCKHPVSDVEYYAAKEAWEALCKIVEKNEQESK